MEKKRTGIDIIIPIYNAYDDLVKCINSITKYTDLTLDRLILINDKSPDERIKEYLDGLGLNNLVVIHNEQNMGFSNNVNKGMNYSDNRDVLLLNSDTVVTKNWIDKIYRCAYSDRAIGTVTPLSNSATLCSVPITCQDNNIPDGLGIDDMAYLVEKYSIKAYPRITVAVGFCMFIKREVIETVGLFDAETFEKGYGEENDFCNRAEQFGYYHVMCDDTFIYHKGTVSFKSEEKIKLIEEHDKILNERYAEQMNNNSVYCIKNPDQYIRDNLNVHIDLHNGRKNLLYMLHLDFRSDVKKDVNSNVGGTQFHVKDLTDELKFKFNIFVLSRDKECIHLTIYIDDKIHRYKFYIGQDNLFMQFRNDKMKELYGSILDYFRISIVHIHHIDGLSLDMYYAASERNIPLVQTIHDFYAVSPSYKLLDENNKYISPDCMDEKVWENSARKFAGYANTVNIIPKWRREFEKAYNLCDIIVYPHEATRDILLSYYPGLTDKSIIIHHGTDIETADDVVINKTDLHETDKIEGIIDLFECYEGNGVKIQGWSIIENVDSSLIDYYITTDISDGKIYLKDINKLERADICAYLDNKKYLFSGFSALKYVNDTVDEVKIVMKYDDKYYSSKKISVLKKKKKEKDKINIAFLGGMVPEKGSEIAYEMVKCAPKEEFEWYSIGIVGDKKLNDLEQDNFHKTGEYQRNDLIDIIAACKIDIICILSIWPETFCYTLSEAIISNTPVLVTDIGAHGYRVKENGYGWYVDYNSDAQDIIDKIRVICENKDEYERVKAVAVNYKEKSVHEMCSDYIELYESLNTDGNLYKELNNRRFLAALTVDGDNVWNPEENYNSLLMKKNDLETGFNIANGKLELAKQEITNIKDSRSYKLVRKIARILRRN